MDRFEGSAEAKERLKAIIEAMTGASTVAEACVRLGVGESRFFQLRDEMLAGALSSLEPKMPGRPARQESEEAELLAQMDKRLRRLELELEAAHVRTELALTMPHLMHVPGKKKKKARKRVQMNRRPRRDG